MLDPDAVTAAAAGDVDQLERLLRDAAPTLRRQLSIAPGLRRSLDVEDVIQVTMLEAFLRIRSLQERTPAGFHAWLRRLAEHNLTDAVRALERKKRPDHRDRVTHGGAGESSRTLLAALADPRATAGSAAVLAEAVEHLHAAIALLPASYREVITAADLAERTIADVAAQMQRTVGAVHMLRARAHDRLRELLRR